MGEYLEWHDHPLKCDLNQGQLRSTQVHASGVHFTFQFDGQASILTSRKWCGKTSPHSVP
jgi:hypothetical protein